MPVVAFDGDADRAHVGRAVGPRHRWRRHHADRGTPPAERRASAGQHCCFHRMSNLGLEKALERAASRMLRTPVGDKYVLEEMLRRNAALGGEQSGHVIFREYATTGDGMLTALKVLETCVHARSKTLDELAADLERLSPTAGECTSEGTQAARPDLPAFVPRSRLRSGTERIGPRAGAVLRHRTAGCV